MFRRIEILRDTLKIVYELVYDSQLILAPQLDFEVYYNILPTETRVKLSKFIFLFKPGQ